MRIRQIRLNKAFTLIELLVVVAIIIILMGILMPVIGGARKRGRDALCKTNLKQLQVAAMTYAISDGGGSLPSAKSTENFDSTRSNPRWRQNTTGWLNWADYSSHNDNDGSANARPGETYWWGPKALTCITNGALWKYVKSAKVYACPQWQNDVDGMKAPQPFQTVTISRSSTNYPWRCYGMNKSVSGANIGDIEASKRLLFAEQSILIGVAPNQMAQRTLTNGYTSVSGSTEALGWDGAIDFGRAAATYPYENVGLYHYNKANVIFVDGHIEALDWRVTTNAASGNW